MLRVTAWCTPTGAITGAHSVSSGADSLTNLNSIARAGDPQAPATGDAAYLISVNDPAAAATQLANAFDTIRTKAASCSVKVPAPPAGDRPIKFEHVSVKVRRPAAFERFLRDGLGLRFSDRMGPFASWWHCDEDHHGVALTRAPRAELSHYAYAWPDLNALGRVADRLRAERDRKLVWGPSRHGPGNNHFAYLHDADGAMIEHCSELALMPPAGDYQARRWRWDPTTINQWGGPPPLRFLLTGYPIAPAEPGRPSWAAAPVADH